MIYCEVAQRIRDLRIQRGLTQTELGRMLDVSKSVISAYENGVHQPPYDVLIRLSGIFGVTCDYLLGVSSKPTLIAEGLTDMQIKSLQTIIDELRRLNMESQN